MLYVLRVMPEEEMVRFLKILDHIADTKTKSQIFRMVPVVELCAFFMFYNCDVQLFATLGYSIIV